MSIPVRIVICAENEAVAQAAAEAAFRRVHKLDAIMTDFDSESELIQLCIKGGQSGEPVPVSRDLFRVLNKAKQISTASDGAFDVSVGPIVRLWRRARRMHIFPEQELLDRARLLVGNELWEIDESAQTVTLKKDKMRFDLGGIAKGDIIDQAIETLKAEGITAALVDAGGDVRVYGVPPQTMIQQKVANAQAPKNLSDAETQAPVPSGWLVGVSAHGKEVGRFVSDDMAMASSGDMSRFVTFDGVRYSHIVDPKTGLGLTSQTAVTVLAPDAITADALASALSVLPPEKGLKLLEQFEGSAAMICQRNPESQQAEHTDIKENTSVTVWTSGNWSRLVDKLDTPTSVAP